MKPLLLQPSLYSILHVIIFLLLLRLFFSFKSLLYLLSRLWRCLEDQTQVYQYFSIPRFSSDGFHENHLFRKAFSYISALPSLQDSDSITLYSSSRNDFHLHLTSPGHSVSDHYLGARLSWSYESSPDQRFILKLRRQDRHRVLLPYLQQVETLADEIELRRREIKLFTHVSNGWKSVPFTHPATLDTVAMDADVKSRVKSDLESFIKGRAYYHRLGRVWRRSYLLHGPPGTGKSSFAAAMAKFLCYDIYDFDLSRFSDVSEMRAFLLQTTPRSVILVEDLDLHLSEEKHTMALSGVLNFMDGVFSCCGEERVMVVTMTAPPKDSAVLRPGRVDVHVHFPLCDFGAFKTLASSYLGLKDHKLYPQVEEVFQSGARLSPAEVGEIMLANRASPSRALKSVINALQQSSSCSSSAVTSGRLTTSATRRVSDAEAPVSGELACGAGNGLGFGKDATLREFRKLYGFIKRSGSKKEGVLTVEAAAAAAAASAAAANAGDKDA